MYSGIKLFAFTLSYSAHFHLCAFTTDVLGLCLKGDIFWYLYHWGEREWLMTAALFNFLEFRSAQFICRRVTYLGFNTQSITGLRHVTTWESPQVTIHPSSESKGVDLDLNLETGTRSSCSPQTTRREDVGHGSPQVVVRTSHCAAFIR